jgi:hypothetical protein
MAVSTVTGVIVGTAGVTLLYHSAKVVVLLASIVGKVFATLEDKVRDKSDHTKPRDPNAEDWKVEDVLPVEKRDWQKIAIDALTTVVLATFAMYVINRFCPSVVADANKLLHRAVPLQFTPNHIPLTRYAGI